MMRRGHLSVVILLACLQVNGAISRTKVIYRYAFTTITSSITSSESEDMFSRKRNKIHPLRTLLFMSNSFYLLLFEQYTFV